MMSFLSQKMKEEARTSGSMQIALYVIKNATKMNLPRIAHHHLRRWGVALHKIGLLDKPFRVVDSVDALDPALG